MKELKNFTVSEKVAIKKAVEPYFKELAKERQRKAGKYGKTGGRGKNLRVKN